jgi:ADP-heptose:LPS heptosyltransferase
VVHPGSGNLATRWPWERFAETLRLVARRRPVTCLVIRADGVALSPLPDLPRPSKVIVLESPPDLDVLAALIARGRVFLGNESGPSHVAAAVGTPAVVPFLSGNDPRRWGPAGEAGRVLEGDVGIGPDPAAVAEGIVQSLDARESGRDRRGTTRDAGAAHA